MSQLYPWRLPQQWAEHRALLAISIPMILSNITLPLLGLVDTAVVGHLSDDVYLGGTAVGSMLITLVLWLAGFLRMTTTGLAAQALGAQRGIAGAAVLWRGLLLSGVISALLLLFQQPLIRWGLALAGGSSEVQWYAAQYVQIRVWGIPAALISLVLVGWLLGMQESARVMWLLILTNLVNIVLDIVFVPLLGWQVAGVAWATLIAEYLGLLLGAYWVVQTCHDKGIPLVPDWSVVLERISLAQYGRLNRDVLIRTLCLEAVFAFMTFQGARLGDTVVAANAILMGFLLLVSFGLDGVAYGAEARVGLAKGADSARGIRRAAAAARYWTGVLAILFSGLFALLGSQLLGLMTSLPHLILYAEGYLVWMVVLPLIAAWCYLYDGIYIGLTLARVMRNSLLLATLGVFFPLWYGVSDWGNMGLWLAFTCFMGVRGLTLAWHFHRMSDAELLR